MLRVYTASKMSMAPMWIEINKVWPEVFFHARWLKHHSMKTPDDSDAAEEFWIQDEEDVLNADAVILYATEGEHLKGALVEAGMAIANRIPLIVVGEHPDYGTWQYHPTVTRVKDLFAAREKIVELHAEIRARSKKSL